MRELGFHIGNHLVENPILHVIGLKPLSLLPVATPAQRSHVDRANPGDNENVSFLWNIVIGAVILKMVYQLLVVIFPQVVLDPLLLINIPMTSNLVGNKPILRVKEIKQVPDFLGNLIE